jgi:hypothetical protein
MRQGSLAGGIHGGPVPTSSLLNSVRYMSAKLFVGGKYLSKTLQIALWLVCTC